MSTLSVDGLVSGLDTTSIVSQIIELERRPINLLETKQGVLSEQTAAWQKANSLLLAFETAAQKLNTKDEFNSNTAKFVNNSSSGGSVLTVSAGGNASEGVHDITVSSLAKVGIWSMQGTPGNISDADAALGSAATITITHNATDYDISVAAGDSLNDIKTAINASSAPVTATVFNAGTSANPNYTLVVTGDDTGTANDINITEDHAGLATTEEQVATDAVFNIDGVDVTRSSNTVTDVLYDTTIELQTAGSGTVTTSTDYDSIISKTQDFMTAYNDVMDYIKEQFTYNQETSEKGTLFGNGSLLTIQNQLRSIVSGAVPGIDETDSNNLAFLSQVGIKTNESDHLVMDEDVFTDTLKSDYSKVRALFVSDGSGDFTIVGASGATSGGTYNWRVNGGEFQVQLQGGDGSWITMDWAGGYATGRADTIAEGLILETGSQAEGASGTFTVTVGVAERVATNTAIYTEYSTEGLIFNQRKSIEDQDKEIQAQIDDLEDRIKKKEEDLKTKFANLETLLSKLNADQSYLDQQLSTLSKGWK